MSKKHFIELARIIRDHSNPKLFTFSAVSNAQLIAEHLADFCAKQNPNFDRARFLEACNVNH